MHEYESSQDDIIKAKAHIETLHAETRALHDELEQQMRAKRSLQQLVETVEAEKSELEKKIAQIRI